MAELLIMRHAKSSWDMPSLADHDRPLNGRGRRAAPKMGELLAAEDLLPDAVLCSNACRTMQTWDLLSTAAGCDVRPRFREEIYLADGGDLLKQLHAIPSRSERGMIIGHNPSMEELVAMLTGRRVRMPTASLVLVQTQGRWESIRSGRFVRQWKVKEL